MTTSDIHERVARAVFDRFASLPQKCKPRSAANDRDEWTPLAAVVMSRESDSGFVQCISLATGTKCVPAHILPQCGGTVVHDSHAEVLALRGFNRWVLHEIRESLVTSSYSSPYVRRQDVSGSESRPFRIADDISLHFFTTEAPCGDASMELLIESKAPEDVLPWTIDENTTAMPGRGHFSLLGRVRRKPARADAPVSLSKSCSDKLALKQVTSILSFPSDLFVQVTSSTFLRSVTVPASQFNQAGFERAFGPTGRVARIEKTDPHFFDCVPLPEHFPSFQFQKNRSSLRPLRASNTSTIYIHGSGTTCLPSIEVLLNGVKQGFKQLDTNPRKQSVVCRRQMWLLGVECFSLLNAPAMLGSSSTYQSVKTASSRFERVRTKTEATDGLGNWVRNSGDESWTMA
jgi:tRNA-specific adenosine deaminase 1